MFAIDTGADGGGSQGPWIGFKPKGSAQHSLKPASWYIRDKTEDGEKTMEAFGGMATGIVLDLYAKGGELCGSLKLGFSKSDGQIGVAPDRRWWSSPLKAEKRPDESRTAHGGYVWSNALSVRCAIGGGKTATWEDDGWGVYKGFSTLIKQINAGFEDNEGKCPMVRSVGHVAEGSGTKGTNVPIFEIIKWVPRPDCLKEDAPTIGADFDEPAPAPKPAEKPAPAPAVADADEF